MKENRNEANVNDMGKFAELIQNVAALPEEKREAVSIYAQGVLSGIKMGMEMADPQKTA